MVVGTRDDELVRLDVFVKDELAGLRTFDPEILRRFATCEVIADFRPDAGDPVHDAVLSPAYMDRLLMAGNCQESPRCVVASRSEERRVGKERKSRWETEVD